MRMSLLSEVVVCVECDSGYKQCGSRNVVRPLGGRICFWRLGRGADGQSRPSNSALGSPSLFLRSLIVLNSPYEGWYHSIGVAVYQVERPPIQRVPGNESQSSAGAKA